MDKVVTIDPNEITTAQLHGYLLAAVAPRPVAFASTVDPDGNINLSPFSFFNVFSANPPIMIFSPARRGRDNTTKHTYENIKAVPETVINIVNYTMVEQTSLASTEYDRGVNEFQKAGFTEVASEKVKPPRVGEAPVSFECVVDQVIELGDQGGAGNLIISRAVLIHIQQEYLSGNGRIDTTELDLIGRMGGNWYCRASGQALFEIPKPQMSKGIGVDQLPVSVQNSRILTGNLLGRLGNTPKIPGKDEIEKVRSLPEVQHILDQRDSGLRQDGLHSMAKDLLEAGETEKALALLFIE